MNVISINQIEIANMSSLLILILVASVYLSSAAIRPSNYQSNRKPIITANTIKNLLKEARDEVIDCFDSVVFAENGAERWAALEEIGRRHQRGFTIISAGLVIATVLGRKR